MNGNIKNYGLMACWHNFSQQQKILVIAAAVAAMIFSAIFTFPGTLIPESLFYYKYAINSANFFFSMPGSAFAAEFTPTTTLLFRIAAATLSFDAARRLSGIAPGLSAAAISLLFREKGEQVFFAFWIMLFVDAAIWRQGKESIQNAFLLGLALGATFLVRSGTIFFPLAYTAYEVFFSKGPLRQRSARALAMIFATAIVLSGWNLASTTMLGKPLPFELHRADCNLVTGALGSVLTIEGDFRAIAGLSDGEGVFPWVLRYILSHPLEYLSSVIERLTFFISNYKFMVVCATTGFILISNKKRAALPAMMTAAFILAHIMLSVEQRYFYPVLVLLSVFAGSLFSFIRVSRDFSGFFDQMIKMFLAVMFCWIVYINAVLFRAVYMPQNASDTIKSEAILKSDSGRFLKYASETYFSERDLEKGYLCLELSAEKGLALSQNLIAALKGDPDKPVNLNYGTEEVLGAKLFRFLEAGEWVKAKAILTELNTFFVSHRWKTKDIGKDGHMRTALERIGYWVLYDRHLISPLLCWPDSQHAMLLARLSRILPLRQDLALRYIFSVPPVKPEKVFFWHEKSDGTVKTAKDIFVEMMAALKFQSVSKAENVYAKNKEVLQNSKEGLKFLLEAGFISNSPVLLRDAISAVIPGSTAAKTLSSSGKGEELRCLAMNESAGLAGFEGLFSETINRQKALGLVELAAKSAECGLGSKLPVTERMFFAISIQDLGKPELADKYFTGILAEIPESAAANYNSGVAKFLAGDYSGAAEKFKKVTELDPNFPHTREALLLASKRVKNR